MPARSRLRPVGAAVAIGVAVLALVLTGSVVAPGGTAADPTGGAVSSPGTAGPAGVAGTATGQPVPDLAAAGPPGGDFVGGVETVTGTVTTLVLGLV